MLDWHFFTITFFKKDKGTSNNNEYKKLAECLLSSISTILSVNSCVQYNAFLSTCFKPQTNHHSYQQVAC